MALKSEVLLSHEKKMLKSKGKRCSNLHPAAVKKGSRKEDSLTLMRQQYAYTRVQATN